MRPTTALPVRFDGFLLPHRYIYIIYRAAGRHLHAIRSYSSQAAGVGRAAANLIG